VVTLLQGRIPLPKKTKGGARGGEKKRMILVMTGHQRGKAVDEEKGGRTDMSGGEALKA